jgi:aldose sugar dehydrogenase
MRPSPRPSARRPALALTLALALLGAAGLGGCVRTPPLTETTVVSGLEHVWDIGFLPDGTMLYTERPGRISAFVDGQKRLLNAPADVVRTGEAGVMGMAIDPHFAFTRYVFVCLVSTLPSQGEDVRLARFQLNAAGTALVNRVDIVTGAPANVSSAEAGRHSGCRPRFGPDGHLWVGMGDAAQGSTPQNAWSLGGKVLRIDREGKGVPFNMGAPYDPRIFSIGHRNVQGLAFRPSDGLGVSTEHGPDRDDELNRLDGGNFGWDPRPPGGGEGYDESVPMTDLAKYPGAHRALASSGSPTIAPAGASFVTGSRWGTWDGVLAVATLKGEALRTLRLVPHTGELEDSGITMTGYGRLRAVTQGPDGDLYVSTSNGGNSDRIIRLTPR